jgi:hypothetical protein
MWRAPVFFCVLVYIAFQYFDYPAALAIEVSAIAFFAGLGSLQTWLDKANLSAQKSGEYFALDHAAWMVPVVMIAGMALALGGGVLRRLVEVGAANVLSLYYVPMSADCYVVPNLLLPSNHVAWGAAVWASAIGAIIAIAVTWRVAIQTHEVVSPGRVRNAVDREAVVIDGFATGMFAGFGMAFALTFIDGLPMGLDAGLPTQWSIQYTPAVWVVVCIFSALTACGGGLIKDVISGSVAHGPHAILATLRRWPLKKSILHAAAFGGLSYFTYWAFTGRLQHEPHVCLTLNAPALLAIAVFFGLVGCGVWHTRHRI